MNYRKKISQILKDNFDLNVIYSFDAWQISSLANRLGVPEDKAIEELVSLMTSPDTNEFIKEQLIRDVKKIQNKEISDAVGREGESANYISTAKINYRKKIMAQMIVSNVEYDLDNYYSNGTITPELENATLYLNTYERSQAYGGPEEGGWWYNIYEAIDSQPVKGIKNAVELQNKLNQQKSKSGEYTGTNPLPSDSEDIEDQVGDRYSEGTFCTIEAKPAESHDDYAPYS